jgi:hypothetical protein
VGRCDKKFEHLQCGGKKQIATGAQCAKWACAFPSSGVRQGRLDLAAMAIGLWPWRLLPDICLYISCPSHLPESQWDLQATYALRIRAIQPNGD